MNISPPVFQRAMMDLLYDFLGQGVWVYIDDIIVYTPTWEGHLELLDQVLCRILGSGFILKKSKCYFGMTEIVFLGFKINEKGITPNEDKTAAVTHIPYPKSVKEVRQFLGFTSYYRRFIPEYAHKAKPLYDLLKKDAKLEMTDDRRKAMDALKQALISAPILQMPDFTENRGTFKLRTDASDIGVGAILLQIQEGQWHVIEYSSKTLTSAERNYTVTEKECLAILVGLRKFRHYLLGQQFIIETDHSALTWLRTCKHPPGRLLRWALSIAEYDFIIQHRKGDQMQDADALSRAPLPHLCMLTGIEVFKDHELPNLNEELLKLQQEDSLLQTYKAAMNIPEAELKEQRPQVSNIVPRMRIENKLLQYKDKRDNWLYVVPDKLKMTILYLNHDIAIGGHLGKEKTLQKIKKRWWWYAIDHDVALYVKTCDTCQRTKGPPTFMGDLEPLPMDLRPWQRVATDILGPLPKSRGYNYVLVFTDAFTKYVEIDMLKQQSQDESENLSSASVATSLLNKVVYQHGVPHSLVSDQGTNFVSEVMQQMYEALGIKKKQTTAYHASANGQVERFNHTIIQMLKPYVNKFQNNWVEFLAPVVFAYNTSVHITTGYSPFFLNYGCHPVLPDLISARAPEHTDPTKMNLDAHIRKLLQTLEEAYKQVRAEVQEKHAKQIDYYQQRNGWRNISYEPYDQVMLYTPKIQVKGTKKKLTSKWTGPFTIKDRVGKSTYTLVTQEGTMIKPVNITRLRPYFDRTLVTEQEWIAEKPKLFSFDHLTQQSEETLAKAQEELLRYEQAQEEMNSEDWRINPQLFENLIRIGGKVNFDLFASNSSAVCPAYFTRENNALNHDWQNLGRLWINPPFRLTSEVLAHLEQYKVHAIVIFSKDHLKGFEDIFIQPLVKLPDLKYQIFKIAHWKKPIPNKSQLVILMGIYENRTRRQISTTTTRWLDKTKHFQPNEELTIDLGVEVVNLPHNNKPFPWPEINEQLQQPRGKVQSQFDAIEPLRQDDKTTRVPRPPTPCNKKQLPSRAEDEPRRSTRTRRPPTEFWKI